MTGSAKKGKRLQPGRTRAPRHSLDRLVRPRRWVIYGDNWDDMRTYALAVYSADRCRVLAGGKPKPMMRCDVQADIDSLARLGLPIQQVGITKAWCERMGLKWPNEKLSD
jgi:hypothetical protein